MLWIYILITTLAGATVHAVYAWRRGLGNRTVEFFLVYLLVGYYGLAMIVSGLVHLLNPGPLAALKGWPASPPMHALYSFALFGLAASASLSIWFRGKYLLAPAISGSVLAFGGAYVHAAEMVNRGNFVMAKDGPEILFDVVVPLTILTLAGRHVLREKQRGI